MSAQIIEFPMNRVRPAQPAPRTSRHYSERASRPAARQPLSRSAALLRAAFGWTIIFAIAIALILGAGKQLQAAQAVDGETSTSQKVSFEYVTVKSGDTLWGIAEKYAPNRDPRDFIADLVALNNLSDSVVDAGMRLALPN